MSGSGAQGQIVAMGGGGFLMEPENPLLDDFALSLSRRQPARLCLLPTAAGESTQLLVRFYRAFSGRASTTDLTLFHSPLLPRQPARSADIEAFLLEQDVIYVSGGNTANLLALWRAHGIDRALRAAWHAGTVLCGVSAGMLCWFEAGVTDSFGEGLAGLNDGLGFLPGSACPHYDGEALRRPTYQRLVGEGFPAGYAADDGVGLHFSGRELVGAVSSRPHAAAYRVESREGKVSEEPLSVRYLGE